MTKPAVNLCCPRISVVIPCRDRIAQLETCLAAVTQLNPPACEVIVVDSYSQTGDEIRNAASRNGARYLRLERPGVSLAKNTGARAARGDIVAFLDDDAVPAHDWIAHLLSGFTNPRVACVTSTTEPAPEARNREDYELLGYVRGRNAPSSIAIEEKDWFRAACFGGIGISPGLSIRKSVFSQWTGFHERLGPGTPIVGAEEGHVFLDLVRLGYLVQHAPMALVFHPVPVPDRETLQKRYYTNLAAATAFVLMLMFEERGCRWPALMYLVGKLRKVSSLWRREVASRRIALAPGWRVMLARASGILCYMRSVVAAIGRKTDGQVAQHDNVCSEVHGGSVTDGTDR